MAVKVEEILLKYIVRFVRYSRFAHIPGDRKQILLGTFLYLLDEEDLIPDDVPNIGFMDDLGVFLCAAEYFCNGGQTIPGVCSPDEVAEDLAFLKKHEGLLYGVRKPSVELIKKKGKGNEDLFELGEKIKAKYSHLGKVDA